MAGILDFVSKGYFDTVFNVGVGVLFIIYSYKWAAFAKAKGKPVPFLKIRLLRFLGVLMLVGTLLWALIERFLLKSQ